MLNKMPNKPNKLLIALLLLGMQFCSLNLHAQIRIGGDVYGGGKNGAVGTGNTEATNETDSTSVTLTDATIDVTTVTINDGDIRTVFGGGENGRAYGQTNVNITGKAVIGGTEWKETIHGGVFGAGDGWKAHVYGGSKVTVTGGTIYNNVYGGGNMAALIGKTTVLLQGGDNQGCVYGGARMANIFGYSHVNIDGANALNDLIVNGVYGGNDISGNVSKSGSWGWVTSLTMPSTLTKASDNGINDSYNAFVQSTESTDKNIFVGQLFAGGNGDYEYEADGSKLKLSIKTGEKDDDNNDIYKEFTGLERPEVGEVYLELAGGTYGYAYGGGNAATVTGKTDICIMTDETKAPVTAGGSDPSATKVTDVRLVEMGINLTTFTNDYQFIRVFGGNNKADMSIRPTWHLLSGTINNLYSGGNMGRMTNENGVLLTIMEDKMVVNNVYGGCRKADVDPGLLHGVGLNIAAETTTTPAYTFPENYSAKVYIGSGKITNVYGGNDVSGNVYGGTNVEIHGSIIGDVYGGGNGSYAYTDNSELENDAMYGDFYYSIPSGKTSAQALNMHRPNVEKSFVHVAGESDSNPTYIGGALYCGGNSATLRKIGAASLGESDGTTARLQFGSHVVARSMFLGSNGVNMINGIIHELNGSTWTDKNILEKYAETSPADFSQMNLLETTDFEEYMRGIEVAIKPIVVFDDDYVPYSTKVGSLYCGGNVGSMSASGYFEVDFLNSLVVFEKLVGGCNDANVAAGTYNAAHEGGLITQNTPVKVELNIDGLKLEPRKLTYDTATNTYSFDWNTDASGQLIGGNIYGGCYSSGYVNGGVLINLKSDAISEAVTSAISGGTITKTLEDHRDALFSTALSAFGGGYGEKTEIRGSAWINISNSGNIVKVFGGGQEGYVNESTNINLTAGNVGKIYGGGYEGPVLGNSIVNLNGGTVYDVIGGACNAQIGGHTETYIGTTGFPTITNNVYGANDFGGEIQTPVDFVSKVSTTAADKVYNSEVTNASAYIEYTRGSVNYIFGGAKASYDYRDQTLYSAYVDADGNSIGDFVKPIIGNAFVNFRPVYAANSSVKRVYGAGQGYYNESDKDLLQDNSYVLIDIPSDVENFATLEVFGAGDYSGVGMNIPAATVRSNESSSATDVTAAAVIDLISGNINSVYGGSYKQGFTRRTIVNVPVGSTIDMNYLYGGAYGVAAADGHTLGNIYPCDVYESNVNYKSGTARVRTIYGGNNSYRRTLYTHVNIHTPVRYVHRTYGLTHANIFGAGYGENTWAQYTEVNLLDSAKVYESYGGGEAGSVYNKETITSHALTNGWNLDMPGDYGTTDASYDHGGLDNALAHSNQLYADYSVNLPDADANGIPDINIAEKYNTNVHINRGATVVNYAYGAGLGSHIYTYQFDGNHAGSIAPQPSDYIAGATTPEQLDAEARAKYESALAAYNTYGSYTNSSTVGANEYNSFNDTQKSHWTQIGHRTTAVVSGTSYIDLLGGTVTKDLYAAGTTGAVQDTLMLRTFTATSTAYVKGGTTRNVYGGGWEGPVGKYDMSKASTYDPIEDVTGVTNVIVGRPEKDIAAEYALAYAADNTIDEDEFFYFNGVPAIKRNAYAGGEGGVVRGTANLNIFNGFVGYKCKQPSEITESENNYYKLQVQNGHVTYIPLERGDDLSDEAYYFVEEIDQDAVGDNIMFEAGNAFGGGYAANSDVDIANLTLWNGIIRNSLYGGGEIATIGRGIQVETAPNEFEVTIRKPGETHVTMWGGHVLRDVFGGGRGFNNWKTEDKTEGNTNGYVFGKTDVNIHMGTIGTLDGVSKGYGNVFGGGNIGFVYSQYPKKSDGWYYEDYNSTPKKLSEDTRVEVRAYGKALTDVTIGGTAYQEGIFIPNTALDQLSNSDEDKVTWEKVDQSGVTIYNAVFAGGNVSAGSDKIMAFSKTVYGNSTASVVDIYARDLISVGGNGVGGLYGDGNLTFVDGYRELNITNYGTDWHSLSGGVSDDAEFNALTPRQQSFYITQYTCTTAYGSYEVGDVIMSDVYQLLDASDKSNWARTQSIVNEGRYINTVQRCDFCGIKGSRIVLHGAIDRAQDESEADYTNYTINRVGELSLNQNRDHGSYFGIYNVVKFLGGVTSDVRFAGADAAVRQTNSSGGEYAADGRTYYAWKQAHQDDNLRNDGTAPNKIALASGVFLEIVKELDTNGDKVYGPITGVIELDLLNVSPGEGGGYVYAKNIHGTPSYTATYADVISDANQNLVTNRAFEYADAVATDEMQTSGNFIHSQPKRILDDCFPQSKSFAGSSASPAHYWYIRGEFYIYDQLVSAYTGAADAYSTEMRVPLTMAIQGNAKLRLLNVLPGLYADPAKLALRSYNADEPELSVSDSISVVNNAIIKTYGQGDPISYWDWYNATTAERNMFVMDTDALVCNIQATIGDRTYYPGEAISISHYNTIKEQTGVDIFGEEVKADTLFSVINEVSHANGYMLTVDFSNPSKWDDYYRHHQDQVTNPADPIKKAKLQELLDACSTEDARKALLEAYVKSATFTCNYAGTYGQYYFNKDEIISHNVYEMRTNVEGHVNPDTQAEFVAAYIAKADCEVSVGGEMKSFTKGTPISASDYATITNNSTYFEPAYICVSTVLVNTGDYRVLNQLVGETEWSAWSSEVKEKFQQAYFCTKAGSWGGKYYEAGNNYNGVDYGQLLPEERLHFTFNYDALDVLLYNNYVGNGTDAFAYNALSDFTNYINRVGGTNRNSAISVFDKDPENPFYAVSARLDYTATFNSNNTSDQFKYVKGGATKLVVKDVELNNDEYESLPNDRKYYASFAVSDNHLKDKDNAVWSDGNYHTFIVKRTFDVAGNMYNAGKSITHTEYSNLTATQQANVDEVVIAYDSESATHGAGTYFFCIEEYTSGLNDANIKTTSDGDITTPPVVDIDDQSYAKGSVIPAGTIIDYSMMTSIPNYQTHFDIYGEVPVEETTLYVPVTADIDALQRDRYVTAIYEYSYTESDASGMNYETRVEKHIINIRIKFLSGTPIIGALKDPDLVLPLETVGLDIPTIQEGAFPILGGGWEIYPNEENAKRHRNGREYINGGEQLYFYQNDYYVSYYALTRMGKTFSDPVPLKVANYQRMADVINDPHHMYINHRDNDRDPKIYIDGRSNDTNGNPIKDRDQSDVERTYANELDAMQAMWRIVNSDYGTEHSEAVNGKSRNILGANNLEFFLQDEVGSQLPSWTSIGDNEHCFGGIFHGNGNTITGLNNSLFGQLCGRVYNLGIMGNFTTGGIANTGDGRIENAWVWTSGTPTGQAVYANPDGGARVINTYYPDANSTFTGSTGNVEITQRTVEDFVNGSVAYDLNRYYLEARYRLNGQKEDGDIDDYIFYRLPDGSLVKDTSTPIVDANGKRPEDAGYIPTYANQVYALNYADTDYARFDKLNGGKVGYVEKYVDDGDFRFADGNKPLKADMRLSATHGYLPIYPDDYIFFGQKLTYDKLNDAGGYNIAHATHPQAAAKQHTTGSGEDVDNSRHGLLINDITDRSENRVYRAPAYFRNGEKGRSVLFNANAIFVDSYDYTINGVSDATHPHHGMTAVDFTGGKGDTHGYQGVIAGLPGDFKDRSNNYEPLLDYERLDGIRTSGITQNLLAYAPAIDLPNTKNAQTNNVLVGYFRDLTYAEDTANPAYRAVAQQDASSVMGHVVLQTSTSIGSGETDYTYQAAVDHFLVDKQDFNAPMAYTFSDSKRMWYQRVPDNYVELEWSSDPTPVRSTKGWEGVCLPFEAELVTTQQKGEITHFYKGSTYGHEYWLRSFAEGGMLKGSVYEANFNYPDKQTGNTKEYTNTFLWDYYYSYFSDPRQDANTDKYQQRYYADTQTYSGYPYSGAGTPYIVGLPGSTYYEFDLSGNFVPSNTYNAIAALDPQVITFASPTGASIAVSDAEIASQKTANTVDSYVFTPNYLNTSVAAGAYVLNASGSSYQVTESATDGLPFRPYFTVASGGGSGAKAYRAARAITFNQINASVGNEDESQPGDDLDGRLTVYSKDSRIFVQSGLREETTVRIINPGGALLRAFTIQPGQTVETRVASGVYIVNSKKVSVK